MVHPFLNNVNARWIGRHTHLLSRLRRRNRPDLPQATQFLGLRSVHSHYQYHIQRQLPHTTIYMDAPIGMEASSTTYEVTLDNLSSLPAHAILTMFREKHILVKNMPERRQGMWEWGDIDAILQADPVVFEQGAFSKIPDA